jgi:hypothetical protein
MVAFDTKSQAPVSLEANISRLIREQYVVYALMKSETELMNGRPAAITTWADMDEKFGEVRPNVLLIRRRKEIVQKA